MEESHQPYQAHSETPLPDSDSNLVYPPKPPAEEPKSRSAILLRSMTSLALYLAIGFFFFRNNWTLLIALTGIVIFHELGHFFAMKFYNYQDLVIFFYSVSGSICIRQKA